MGNVKFDDYRVEVKAALNEATIAWLYEVSEEVKSQAQRGCQMAKEGEEIGIQLKGSYEADVNEEAGEAKIGTPLEAGYWEEYGTGEHAAHGDGRKGWWVYVKGYNGNGGRTYRSEAQAAAVANSLRRRGLDAYHTNGRMPNYTLEKAFKVTLPKAMNALAEKLKGMMGS